MKDSKKKTPRKRSGTNHRATGTTATPSIQDQNWATHRYDFLPITEERLREILGRLGDPQDQEDVALLFELVTGLCAADQDDRDEFSDIAASLLYIQTKEGSEAIFQYAAARGLAVKKQ
ncbi:MAG TPA: hypothetical protein VIQ24_24285 [Pyrinomonadaceae bacterium]